MRWPALLVLLLLTACPSQKTEATPTPLPPPEQQFWTWFSFDEEALAKRARAQNPVPVMLEISRHAQQLAPGIVAEIGVEPEGTPLRLVLSVNGDTKLFPLVKKLAAAAPPLKQWQVVAFRQRRPLSGPLKLEEYVAQPSDFMFKETGRAGGKLDLEIRVKGMTPENEKHVDHAAFLMLDHLIGEYDVETKLSAIDIKPMAVAVDPDLKPLSALAALVDALPPATADGG